MPKIQEIQPQPFKLFGRMSKTAHEILAADSQPLPQDYPDNLTKEPEDEQNS